MLATNPFPHAKKKQKKQNTAAFFPQPLMDRPALRHSALSSVIIVIFVCICRANWPANPNDSLHELATGEGEQEQLLFRLSMHTKEFPAEPARSAPLLTLFGTKSRSSSDRERPQ